jgi:AcrR family transcriptional regulator
MWFFRMPDPVQERLLEAAEQVFAEKGFKAASVRDICKLANANIAAVNYHFGDKERLYIEAVKYAHRGCTQGEPFPEWSADTPAVDKLRDFIRVMVTRMMQPASVQSLQLMMREMAQPTAACVEVVHEYIQPMADKLTAILAELQPGPPQQQALIAFSIVGQCLFYRNHRAIATMVIGEEQFARYQIEQVADHIFAFTLRGLSLPENRTRAQRRSAPTGDKS